MHHVPPLRWALAGTQLRFALADYDAEDDWTFEILEAADDLVVRASCCGAIVCNSVRFTRAALSRAHAFVSFAQGACDVTDGEVVDDKLPPFLVARDVFASLMAGKTAAWASPWTDRDAIDAACLATATIEIDGVAQEVTVLKAEGDNVSLTVLADAAWPLVVARIEGDCFGRLRAVERI